MTPLAQRLAREIAASGQQLTVARWMAHCQRNYYASRDPLGAAGDFVTAPEISQMFGELIGLWLADAWIRAGSPVPVRLVELGPGRGTLMDDVLRSIRHVPGLEPAVHLVETSAVLRASQAQRVPQATWHDELAEVPDDAALLLVANEFFDALPVRQFVRTDAGWRERLVALVEGHFTPLPGGLDVATLVSPALWNAPVGSIVETSPAAGAIAAEIGARLQRSGGAALIVDYGHAGPIVGDTLQAVRAHDFADPFADPGDVDLTCHVDFTALAVAAGVASAGPVGQGDFLRALGIAARAAALKVRATAAQGAAIDAAVERLTGDEAMGSLFKVLALTGSGWSAGLLA